MSNPDDNLSQIIELEARQDEALRQLVELDERIEAVLRAAAPAPLPPAANPAVALLPAETPATPPARGKAA